MPHAPVDAGPAGRVFRTQQPYLFRDVGLTATVYLPVTVRGDRFGALVVALPADRSTPETTASLARVAETLGHALRVADRHTDLYRRTRRTHALSVAGEMQWDTERIELDRQLPLGMFEDTVYAPQRLRLLLGGRLVFVAHGTGEPTAGDGHEAPTVPSPAPSPAHAAGKVRTSPGPSYGRCAGHPVARRTPSSYSVSTGAATRPGPRARDGTGAHADRAGVPLTRCRRV
ncbi:GAF domain-containing protein [Streptomyces sp. WAC01280]|uniref:GAF domain-containing protein n=1 Tax=Streptomyces sp. WAC01280 TaxID=2487424 RepID=UPI0021AF1C87|nr:GAF domain-containing protein [Streptomyces sp. WAC01280]